MRARAGWGNEQGEKGAFSVVQATRDMLHALALLLAVGVASGVRIQTPLGPMITDHEQLTLDVPALLQQHQRVRSANGVGTISRLLSDSL